MGFQLIGPAFSENRILEAAHALESAIGFETAPTFRESGYPIDTGVVRSLVTPAATPAPILRRMEALEKQKYGALSQVLRKHRVLGFSTYGEQWNSMHVNQTMTGGAIYAPEGEAE